MSSTAAVIANVSLMAALIAGLTYAMRLSYHPQSPLAVQAAARVQPNLPRVSQMEPVPFAPHPQSAYEAQHAAGRTARGDREAEDVVATVQRMIDGDYDDWHEEWMATADRIADRASQASGTGSLAHEDVAS
jgi:hypothetical protein